MVGKNFSANNRGQRKKSDFYETPYSITEQLLELCIFNKKLSTLEPACGNGAIVKVLVENGFSKITKYDIERNFLKETRKFKQIITNPPFSLALEFILKAKQVCTKSFCFLLPLSYLHGKERFDLVYSDTIFPLSSVNVFVRYPMLGDSLRLDGKYKTGMMVYAWFVWDRHHKGPATINWIDNQKFIISKKDS